jgi:uncharacterized protein YndB with AHSA1/START domain
MALLVHHSVLIEAPINKVWGALTDIACMKQWMSIDERELDIITTWQVGSPILIKGFHHAPFENKGIVLQLEREHILQYSHLSSLSRLTDKAENYTILTFRLIPSKEGTELSFHAEQFPTESIQKHIDFYWKSTLVILKEWIERE